jgi:hypothetical protein
MTRVILVLVTWCCLHMTCELEAQHLPDAFESLRSGELIRLRTYSHGLHIGTVLRIGPDSLFLEPRRGSRQVEAAAIETLWLRRPATRTGAQAGALAGGLLFAGGAAFMSWAACDAATCSVDPEAAIVGGITGAVMGAITGAVIGAMFGQWHQVHP